MKTYRHSREGGNPALLKLVTIPSSFRATTRNPLLKLLSRLFAIFGLMMFFAISGWSDGASNNSCNGEQISELHSISVTTSHTETGTVSNSDTDDYYYFTPGVTGTLIYNYSSTDSTDFYISTSGCGNNRVVNNGTIYSNHNLSVSSTDTVYIRVKRENGTPDYSIHMTFTVAAPAPEINVVNVADNSTDTSFGSTAVAGGFIDKIYTIQNLGTATLTIGVPIVTGDFTLTSLSAASIAPSASATFTVRFDPSAAGTRIGTVSFANNDSNEDPYNFSISGIGFVTDAINDTYSTGVGATLTVNAAAGVLSNDTGVGISVTSFTAPTSGSVVVNADGSFTYTPSSGFTGMATFTYTMTDSVVSDTATVTITINTVYDNLHAFDRINPENTRYVRGNYAIAGNTVTCLTALTSGYAGVNDACHGMTDYSDHTSNERVNKYIDIDSDGGTWNSTSSYITLPATYDPSAGQGILWAGLFWQGRISNNDDYVKHYAVENGASFTYTETKNAATINLNNTNANKIKLKVDTGSYVDTQASTVYKSENGGDVTYAAFSDVTSILQSSNLQDGKHIFTVANLTTEEGRESSPGLFGGWSLVVIYAEDIDGKTRNLSVYSGFDRVAEPSTAFPISGLKLPTSGAVHANLSLFAGEGETLYSPDSVKISADGTNYDYMPGAVNNENIFDAVFSNINRDAVTGKANDLAINNNGVDVDTFNVSALVTTYRDANPNLDTMYIQWSSGNDYITPSMLAFATELYEPKLCYDYSLKQDGRYLTVDRTNPIAHIQQGVSSSPLELLVYLRNKEADIAADGISIKADVNASRFSYTMTNPIYVSNPNGSGLIDRGIPASNSPENCVYSTASGNGIGDLGCISSLPYSSATIDDDVLRIRKGNGSLGSEEYIYTKFILKPEQISGVFSDINESLGLSLDYYIHVGTVTIPYSDYILGGPNLQMCTSSSAYLPTWGLFNVVQHGQVQNNLKTQIARKPFDVDVIYDQVISTGVNDAPSSTVNTTVQVEMIDVDSFGDLNASCANPDAGVSEPIIVPIAFTPNPAPAYQTLVTSQDSSYHNFALKNGAYRVWYFTETNGTLIQNWTATTDPNSKNKTVTGINGLFNSTSHGDCNASCAPNGSALSQTSGCFSCMKNNYGKPLCSRDNFSVRPEAFDIRIKDYDGAGVNTDLSHDVYGTAPDKNATTIPATLPRINLAAGYDYKYDINATGTEANVSGLTAVPRYTRYFNGPRSDYNITMMWDSPLTNAVCNDVAGRSLSFFIANGMRANQQEHLDQVGDYRLNMIDTSWTAVDQAAHIHTINNGFDAGTDCLVGNNDTGAVAPYGCDISSQHINGSLQYKDQNMNFKPAQFGLGFIYSLGKTVASTITAGGQGFVYMSDLNNTNDMNMSVRSTGQIRALGADGVLTTNFVGGCFAKDLNLTAIHDANLTYTTPFVARMINSTIANVQTYDSLETAQASNWIGTVDDTNFTKADNGALVNTIRFNFDRNQTTPHDPQTVTYSDINVTCALSADCNQSSVRNSTPNTAVGSSAMDFNVTHTYGRVIAKDQRVMGLIAFDGLARYEVYKTDHIFGTLLTVDPDYGDWYINTLHNELTYGDASVTVVDPTTGSSLPNILTSTYGAGIETYKFNAFTVRQGYKAHIDTEGWLWNGIAADIYKDPVNPVTAVDDCDNHPCFNITFGRIIGNTGSAKTESENAKANKNSSSGTGWHSTSEYAPSVR